MNYSIDIYNKDVFDHYNGVCILKSSFIKNELKIIDNLVISNILEKDDVQIELPNVRVNQLTVLDKDINVVVVNSTRIKYLCVGNFEFKTNNKDAIQYIITDDQFYFQSDYYTHLITSLGNQDFIYTNGIHYSVDHDFFIDPDGEIKKITKEHRMSIIQGYVDKIITMII